MMRNKVLKFRPQDYNRGRWLKWARENRDSHGQYNWQQNYSDKFWLKYKRPRVYKVGDHLHYLALHAPRSVRLKWRPAWKRFYKQHPKC
jgi:hypothetical protein